MARPLQATTSDATIRHIPKFGGELWYVSKGGGADTNDGKTPDTAFETIGAALTACAAGDAINVKAGTYTETGLDLGTGDTKDFVELWCEIGTLLDPASGVGLTVSGDSCKVTGDLKITPNAAVGMLISGDECRIDGVKVVGGTHCFHATGAGIIIEKCNAGFPSAGNSGYFLQGVQGQIIDCSTVGNTTTYGYHINNSVDTGVIKNCTSSGHETSGYYIDTGSADWTLLNCSSGADDGKWRDIDDANVWSNFSYASELKKTITLDGSTTYNIFKVTGGVRISDILAHVETIIANTSSTMYLQLYSTGGTVDITDAPGVNIQADVVGTVYVRNEDSTNVLDKAEPNGTPAMAESTNFRDPKTEIDIVEDDTNATYVRMVLSDAVASGVLHWHCSWKPLTDEGILEVI